jgi:hypothetical protein
MNSSSSSKLHNQRITLSVVVGLPSEKGSEIRLKLNYMKAYVSRSVVPSLRTADHLSVNFLKRQLYVREQHIIICVLNGLYSYYNLL